VLIFQHTARACQGLFAPEAIINGMDARPPRGREAARLRRALASPPQEAAPLLLGQVLVRQLASGTQAVRIVETEAYLGAGDAAAHSFRGRTARTEPLWGPPGTIYVYFIYGMHHCLNLSVDRQGSPGCVLIRAAEPLPGSGLTAGQCSGPGRLCRTLQLDTRHSGGSVFAEGSGLWLREGAAPARIAVSPRIGITRAAERPERPLRFYDAASRAVSGPRRPAQAR
jgi:DNA-3-methyladenine glycosylase